MFSKNVDSFNRKLEYNGMYRGKVLDNKDPLKAGRVKIHVYGVYDDIDVTFIPWAIYADSFMGGSVDKGGFTIPSVDDTVWVFFENGDYMLPVFFAGSPCQLDMPVERNDDNSFTTPDNLTSLEEKKPVVSTEYPNNHVIKTKAGNVIELDDSEDNERISIKHVSGTQLVIDNTGSLFEYVTGDKYTYIAGKYVIRTAEDIDINTNGKYIVKADSDIDMEAGANIIANTPNGKIYLN